MSQTGVQKFASILTLLQNSRIELLGGDKQDILLGQLLGKMNDVTKDDFCRIVTEYHDKKTSR